MHFVKRSPSRSPAKMMSREEAAEMMLRTELRESASRSSSGGQFEVDAANARADAAERRSFEMEENAALRVAEAEELADAAQDAAVEASTRARMEASLRAELERELAAARGDTAHRAPPEPRVHHPVVEPASTHVDVSIDRSRGVSPSPAKPAEPAPASEDAVAVANRRRMRAELDAEDARARLSAALANLDETRHELETERRRRASVEVKLAAHETRRANAVESLIARERRRGERAIRGGECADASSGRTSFTAELRRGRDRDAANAAEAVNHAATPNQAAAFAASASVASVADVSGLTSAEEDLVALEAEHQRERDHLRGELVSARAEMAAGIVAANDAREDAAAARAEADAARADVNRVYDGLRRADRGLGVGGARAGLVALRALDALEGRAVGVYKVAAGALDLCRRACDAAEDALDDVESAAERDATENLEEGVERHWRVSRDVLTEAWGNARVYRERFEDVRAEAAMLGASLERTAVREANQRARAETLRRSWEYDRLSAVDSLPSTRAPSAANTPLRLTRRSMNAAGGGGGGGARARASVSVRSSVARSSASASARSSTEFAAGAARRSTAEPWSVATSVDRSPLKNKPLASPSPGPGARTTSALTRSSPARSSPTRSPPRFSSPARSPQTFSRPSGSPSGSPSRSPSRSPTTRYGARASPRSSAARRKIDLGDARDDGRSPSTRVAPTRSRFIPVESKIGAYIRGDAPASTITPPRGRPGFDARRKSAGVNKDGNARPGSAPAPPARFGSGPPRAARSTSASRARSKSPGRARGPVAERFGSNSKSPAQKLHELQRQRPGESARARVGHRSPSAKRRPGVRPASAPRPAPPGHEGASRAARETYRDPSPTRSRRPRSAGARGGAAARILTPERRRPERRTILTPERRRPERRSPPAARTSVDRTSTRTSVSIARTSDRALRNGSRDVRRDGGRARVRFESQVEAGPRRSPPPRKAVMACHKSPSKSPQKDSQRFRDGIVSHTLEP